MCVCFFFAEIFRVVMVNLVELIFVMVNYVFCQLIICKTTGVIFVHFLASFVD